MKINGEATVVKNSGSHYMLSSLPQWLPFPAERKQRHQSGCRR